MNFRIKHLLCIALCCLASLLPAQPFQPLGHWDFNSNNDISGRGHHALGNVLPTNTGVGGNGQYHRVEEYVLGVPFVPSNLDDNPLADTALSIEFWFKSQGNFHQGVSTWYGKSEIIIGPTAIKWIVYRQGSAALCSLDVDLTGTGPADPHNLYDGSWHHYAFTFNAVTREQKLYIDGHCPAHFSKVHPTAPVMIANGGLMFFSEPGYFNRFIGGLDEFAVYNVVLPPDLVYEHFAGTMPYSYFPPTLTAPPPTPSSTPGINILEFGPGYPAVTQTPVQLVDGYPSPRYLARQKVPRLAPFLSQSDVQNLGVGSTNLDKNLEVRGLLERLYRKYNNYLYCGDARALYEHVEGVNLNDPDFIGHHLLALINDLGFTNAERMLTMFWASAKPSAANPAWPASAYIARRANLPQPISLPDHWYLRDSTQPGSPFFTTTNNLTRFLNYSMCNPKFVNDGRRDSLSHDGLGMGAMLNKILQHTNQAYFDFLPENDEQQYILEDDIVRKDSGVVRDMHMNGYSTSIPGGQFLEYQALRIDSMRREYRDAWLPWLTNIQMGPGGIGRKPENWWYDMHGRSPRPYPIIRGINSFRDNKVHPGPTVYPNGVAQWLTGTGATPGMLHFADMCRTQMAYGDSICLPSVSAGFRDGIVWNVPDSLNIRPGSWLGLLKAMLFMGATTFNTFEYDGAFPHVPAAHRPWKLALPAYAQALASREWRFWNKGQVLTADTTHIQIPGIPASFYTFSTGNPDRLVVGRKHLGHDRFLITGCIPRNGNEAGTGPKEKDVTFDLRDNAGVIFQQGMQIKVRNQGSTYFLDLTGPSPLFFQLDCWHEWKDPWHWCHDFNLEAELNDSFRAAPLSNPVLQTEFPANALPGDYRNFITYVHLDQVTDTLDYRFLPTHPDQDSLHLLLKARRDPSSLVANPRIKATIGNQVDTVVVSGNAWGWHAGSTAFAAVPFTQLYTGQGHLLTLELIDGKVDLDLVSLRREHVNPATQPFNVTIMANPTQQCVNRNVEFRVTSAAPAGCIDYHWDFGDGGAAYTPSALHAYQHPGTFKAELTMTDGCEGRTTIAFVVVTIVAPYVDAGPDVTFCDGDTAQLAGQSLSPFHWLPAPNLSSTTVLNPMAWPTNFHYYVLQADSAGCSYQDSTLVTELGLDSLRYVAKDTFCLGDSVQLDVQNAWTVQWAPNPALSATNIPNPWVTPPLGWSSYPFTATGAGGCGVVNDTIDILYRCCVDGATVIENTLNTSAWPYTTNNGFFQVRETLIVDNNITFNNCTFAMDAGAVVRIAGTNVHLTTNNCMFRSACGDSMWQGIVVEGVLAQFTSTGDTIQEAIKGIHSVNRGNYTVRAGLIQDNWIGIHVGPSLNGHAGTVYGTHFRSRVTKMLPPYANAPAEAGIWVEGVQGVGVTVGLGGGLRNRFDSLGIGVLCTRSHVVVVNSSFKGMQAKVNVVGMPGYAGYGSGVFGQGIRSGAPVAQLYKVRVGRQTLATVQAGYSCRFEDCLNGIFVQDNVGLWACQDTFVGSKTAGVRMRYVLGDSLQVRNCHFEQGAVQLPGYGVLGALNSGAVVVVNSNTFPWATPSNNAAISLNDMNVLGLALPVNGRHLVRGNDITTKGIGMRFVGVGRLVVRDNNVLLTGAAPSAALTSAIRIEACTGAEISNNLLRRTNVLPSSQALADGIRANQSTNLIIACNDIYDMGVGFHTFGSCDLSTIRRNDFYGGRRGILLEAGGIVGPQGTQPAASRNTWQPSTLYGPWVCTNSSTGRQMVVLIGTTTSQPFRVRLNLVDENPANTSNPQCNTSTGGLPLLFQTGGNSTTANPACPLSPGAANSPNAIIVEAGDSVTQDISDIVNGSREYLVNPDPSLRIDQQMALEVVKADSAAYMEDPVIWSWALAEDAGTSGKIRRATQKASLGNPSGLQTELSYDPVDLVEDGHKAAMICWTRLMDGTWTVADSLDMATLASNCPLIHGKGVYQARTLMAVVAPLTTFTDEACGGAEKMEDEMEVSGEAAKGWRLAPNPTNGHVSLLGGAACTVKVHDMHGRMVMFFEHDGLEHSISTAGWASGLYVFRCCSPGCELGILRLVVE